jgi:hypothetical protein
VTDPEPDDDPDDTDLWDGDPIPTEPFREGGD